MTETTEIGKDSESDSSKSKKCYMESARKQGPEWIVGKNGDQISKMNLRMKDKEEIVRKLEMMEKIEENLLR